MDRIDKISLKNLIPDPLVGDVVNSDVWLGDVTFERRSVYCIDAASGTGKTSICSFLFGVRNDYQGRIEFNGLNISGLKDKDWCDIRRCHLAYVTQELDLFGELTALENVLLKNRLTQFHDEDHIRNLFRQLGIENRLDCRVSKMSVGQRQRVAIIRAMCQPFDFIILDEPVSHLDEDNNRKCALMIMEEAQRQSAGIIYTSVGNRLDINNSIVLKL